MAYDFKNSRWQSDIASFDRWKFWVEKFKNRDDEFAVKNCERLRDYMRAIQQRWPQFIKKDEIP